MRPLRTRTPLLYPSCYRLVKTSAVVTGRPPGIGAPSPSRGRCGAPAAPERRRAAAVVVDRPVRAEADERLGELGQRESRVVRPAGVGGDGDGEQAAARLRHVHAAMPEAGALRPVAAQAHRAPLAPADAPPVAERPAPVREALRDRS